MIKFIVLLLIYFVITCDCKVATNNKKAEFENRIIHGKPAGDYQFTYQVSLQHANKHHCGGSIISKFKVLTAAHCVTNRNGDKIQEEKFRVMAGSNYLNNLNPLNYYTVNHIVVHPKFDRLKIAYDYAIVFVEELNFNATNISTIRLALQKPSIGTVCYLTGWGDVDETNRKKIPNELQYATITIDPPKACIDIFANSFNKQYMICAGRTCEENAGAGDSGGPLVCNGYLSGIVSFGHRYYDQSMPDVYSSVYYVSDWITKTNGSTRCSLTITTIFIIACLSLFIL